MLHDTGATSPFHSVKRGKQSEANSYGLVSNANGTSDAIELEVMIMGTNWIGYGKKWLLAVLR
jgi:hypothetical protein